MLDLTTLRDALHEMEGARAYLARDSVQHDAELKGYLRTALVKSFEYTYELSHKFMRRFLDVTAPSPADEGEVGFRTLLRLSHEYGIIRAVEPWLTYREKRNITSHGYSVTKADAVIDVVPDFARDVAFLLASIQKRMEQEK